MKKNLVVTVGNEMMGDDAAGPLLARMLTDSPLEDWPVLDAGNAPENYMFKIRESAPERVVIVDTADMERRPGDFRRISKDEIGGLFLMTTHSLPLTYLIEAIEEFVPQVELIGIQPEVVAFGYPVSARVQQAVTDVYQWLKAGGESTRIADAIAEAGQDLEGASDEIDCSAQD